MTFDLDSFVREKISGWGDRMTVGVEVSTLKHLIGELKALRREVRDLRAALASVSVQQEQTGADRKDESPEGQVE